MASFPVVVQSDRAVVARQDGRDATAQSLSKGLRFMAIVLTRKELYDRVWSEPIQKLSKEIGLSAVGLAKPGRRDSIPTPPRGDWAKKQAGHKVRQTPLPSNVPPGYKDTIKIVAQDRPTARDHTPGLPERPEIAAESERTNRIEPPRDDLRVTHPLLRSTRDYWKATRGPSHRWPGDLPTSIRIGVSEPLRARTLRVLQA
jgi:hypothetical protein